MTKAVENVAFSGTAVAQPAQRGGSSPKKPANPEFVEPGQVTNIHSGNEED